MLNGLNSLGSNSISSLLSSGSNDPLASALGGSSSFDSVFTQAMNQANTPAQKMQTALLEVQYNNLNTLYDAVSGDNSTDSIFGSSDSLFGSTGSLAMDLSPVSTQLSQLEQSLGLIPSPTSGAQSSASNTNAAIGLQNQLLLNNDLANFGTDSGSGINTLA